LDGGSATSLLVWPSSECRPPNTCLPWCSVSLHPLVKPPHQSDALSSPLATCPHWSSRTGPATHQTRPAASQDRNYRPKVGQRWARSQQTRPGTWTPAADPVTLCPACSPRSCRLVNRVRLRSTAVPQVSGKLLGTRIFGRARYGGPLIPRQ